MGRITKDEALAAIQAKNWSADDWWVDGEP